MGIVSVLNSFATSPKGAVKEIIYYINNYHKSNEEYINEIKNEPKRVQDDFTQISLLWLKEFYNKNKNKKDIDSNFVKMYYNQYKNMLFKMNNISIYNMLVVRELSKQNKIDIKTLTYLMCFWLDEYYCKTFSNQKEEVV